MLSAFIKCEGHFICSLNWFFFSWWIFPEGSVNKEEQIYLGQSMFELRQIRKISEIHGSWFVPKKYQMRSKTFRYECLEKKSAITYRNTYSFFPSVYNDRLGKRIMGYLLLLHINKTIGCSYDPNYSQGPFLWPLSRAHYLSMEKEIQSVINQGKKWIGNSNSSQGKLLSFYHYGKPCLSPISMADSTLQESAILGFCFYLSLRGVVIFNQLLVLLLQRVVHCVMSDNLSHQNPRL